MKSIELKYSKSNILGIIIILFLIIAGIFYPISVTIFVTIVVFFIIALKSLSKALIFILATHPITRDGFVITIGIFDIHYIYILQLIIILIWLLQNKRKLKNNFKQIKFLYKVLIISLLFAVVSTLIGGFSSAGLREIIKYVLDIVTTYVVYKIVFSDVNIGIKILKKWIVAIYIIAIISFVMSIFFTNPFPSYRLRYEGSKEIIQYMPTQSFEYYTTSDYGQESYKRLEIGFGAPYGSYPCVLMAALLVSLGVLIERKLHFKIKKTVLVNMSFTIFLVLIFTYTRSAWVGLATGVFFLFMFSKYKFQILKITIPLLVFLVIFQPSSVTQRLVQMNPSDQEGSVVSHLRTFQVAVEAINSHPILGVGYANLPSVGDMIDVSRGRGVVHSAILQRWAELGTIGLTLFLIIPFYLFYVEKQIERTKNLDIYNLYNRGIISALIGIAIQSIFIPGLDVIYWFLLGFSLAFTHYLLHQKVLIKK